MSESLSPGPENHQPGNEIVPVEYHMPVPVESSGDNLPIQSWGNEVALPQERENSTTHYHIGQLIAKQEVHIHLPPGAQPSMELQAGMQTWSKELPEGEAARELPAGSTEVQEQPLEVQEQPTEVQEQPQTPTEVLPKPELPDLVLTNEKFTFTAKTLGRETDRERQKRVLYGNGQTDVKFYRSRTDRILDKVSFSKSTRDEGELVRIQSQLRDKTLSNRERDRLSRRAVRLQHRLSGQPGRPSRNAENYEVQGMMIPAFRREASHNRKMERRKKERETYKNSSKTPRELWRSIRDKGEKKQDPPSHRAPKN